MQRQIRKSAILPPVYFSWVLETTPVSLSKPRFNEMPSDVFRHIKEFLLYNPQDWCQIQSIHQNKTKIRELFTDPFINTRYNTGAEYTDFNHTDYENFTFATADIQLHCNICCYCGEFNHITNPVNLPRRMRCCCMVYYLRNRVYRTDVFMQFYNLGEEEDEEVNALLI